MSEYTPPPNTPFTGDTSNPYVASFIAVMREQSRQTTAMQVITAMVRAKVPPWQAEQCLAELTKAIQNIPRRPPRGDVKLQIIDGDVK